jgi:hypothetical protein
MTCYHHYPIQDGKLNKSTEFDVQRKFCERYVLFFGWYIIVLGLSTYVNCMFMIETN